MARPLEVQTLPMPGKIVRQGQRLPASYANFYIANEVVLLPVFQDAGDAWAAAVLQKAFPKRKVVSIDCRELIWGLGAFHCLTQQQPAFRNSGFLTPVASACSFSLLVRPPAWPRRTAPGRRTWMAWWPRRISGRPRRRISRSSIAPFGFYWLSEAQDRAESHSHGVTLFSQPVYETDVQFAGRQNSRKSSSPSTIAGMPGTSTTRNFKALLQRCVQALTGLTHAQPSVPAQEASDAVKAVAVVWQNAGLPLHAGVLVHPRGKDAEHSLSRGVHAPPHHPGGKAAGLPRRRPGQQLARGALRWRLHT